MIDCTLFALSADPSLGKVDKFSLSQQTLMELFVENITNRHKVGISKESPSDISEWMGLKLNDTSEIIEIEWGFLYLEGSIELKWLPCALKDCILSHNRLRGTIDLTCLPDSLKMLSMSSNLFEGTVDLTQLPVGLTYLSLSGNGFTGHSDFSQLPKALRSLYVYDTNLEGEIHFFEGKFDCENSKVVDMRKR